MKHPYYINQDINQYDQYGNKLCDYKKTDLNTMNTEELKQKIKDLETEKQEVIDNYSILWDNILIMAIKNKYQDILDYLKPEPQDYINAKDSNLELIDIPIKKPIRKQNNLMKWIDSNE